MKFCSIAASRLLALDGLLGCVFFLSTARTERERCVSSERPLHRVEIGEIAREFLEREGRRGKNIGVSRTSRSRLVESRTPRFLHLFA
ncbi:ubiquitin carboxyl-terminal hydrolase 32-like isoform 1 [Anopheles sinensis]|uniref:Ubiquitin carboxyl-terminal hydrolase 32-like isoform 1 n=1 Tax=Anopheles sinensis TaxID=74873 RepID=A0A084WIM7_ANOSI|nr:ubiquitin carboxyl-terminal hydrolase 32-like isoform 1 [Anopheles sinensis]